MKQSDRDRERFRQLTAIGTRRALEAMDNLERELVEYYAGVARENQDLRLGVQEADEENKRLRARVTVLMWEKEDEAERADEAENKAKVLENRLNHAHEAGDHMLDRIVEIQDQQNRMLDDAQNEILRLRERMREAEDRLRHVELVAASANSHNRESGA